MTVEFKAGDIAQVKCEFDNMGCIQSVSIVNAGQGYTSPPSGTTRFEVAREILHWMDRNGGVAPAAWALLPDQFAALLADLGSSRRTDIESLRIAGVPVVQSDMMQGAIDDDYLESRRVDLARYAVKRRLTQDQYDAWKSAGRPELPWIWMDDLWDATHELEIPF